MVKSRPNGFDRARKAVQDVVVDGWDRIGLTQVDSEIYLAQIPVGEYRISPGYQYLLVPVEVSVEGRISELPGKVREALTLS